MTEAETVSIAASSSPLPNVIPSMNAKLRFCTSFQCSAFYKMVIQSLNKIVAAKQEKLKQLVPNSLSLSLCKSTISLFCSLISRLNHSVTCTLRAMQLSVLLCLHKATQPAYHPRLTHFPSSRCWPNKLGASAPLVGFSESCHIPHNLSKVPSVCNCTAAIVAHPSHP